ncbi:MAG: cyclic nucleotide-binding domain-containing protein, partial [Anaerolineae bacterium]|nr:cyclic nucleotide-binding domain-containing protein [Anaerolineae bacterium]
MFDQLRAMSIFADYTDEQLAEVARAVREQFFPENAVVLTEGDNHQGVYLLLEGEFEIRKRVRFQDVVISRHQPGAFVGEVALFTNSAQPATVVTTKPSRFIVFDAVAFENFRNTPFALLIASMAERMRSMEAVVYQQDKLSALGKMAAGLAHELNNPASAARRAALRLPEYLERLQALALKLGNIGLTDDQFNSISQFQARIYGSYATAIDDPLAISDREEALMKWLSQQEVSDGFQLAPMLATSGITTDELDAFQKQIGTDHLDSALIWIEGLLTATELIGAMDRSTKRISDLVKAIKGYSYMDQTPQQELDIHDGLESTLTIFGHRLKSIHVYRDYDHTLPTVTAYGGELNQVWTNLFDNALDATGEDGDLTIRTTRENDWLVVEITDSGEGIPEELQSRIFEPFFTTKPMGQGTGLGLDVAYRIITERHQGHIEFTSVPGQTTFRVYL